MLDRNTTAAWVRRLLEFINRDIPAAELNEESADFPPLPFQRRSAAQMEALCVRAEKDLRWLAQHTQEEALAAGIAEEWLNDDAALTSSDYAYVPLDAAIARDEAGRVVLSMPRVRSAEAFIAITIAELLSPDCPLRVRRCALDTCVRLFERELGKRGRPQECCAPAHAATLRTHRHREKQRKTRADKKFKARRRRK